ncbi:MAG TPA: transporter substrate-binding domain-containing protein, partial [Burkholderiaceae bacterium]
MTRWKSGALAAAIVLATSAPVLASQLDDIKAAGVLRVATSLSVAPYTYTDDTMQPTGSDVEAARLLAADLGVKLEVVGTTVSARIPTLQSGKADLVMSVLAKSPEREKVIDFSRPYAVTETVLIGPNA